MEVANKEKRNDSSERSWEEVAQWNRDLRKQKGQFA